jgi:HprK-related kinase A
VSTSLRLSVGAIDVAVSSDRPQVLDDLAALYDGCPASPTEARRGVIEMSVRSRGRGPSGRRRYDVDGDGEAIAAGCPAREVVPQLEWGINWRVIARRSDFLLIHAAVLARDGRGVVVAGNSGAGKSTLAAGLLARGWDYLGDEFALIHPVTLAAHPYPKPLCLKAGAFPVARRLGLPVAGRRHYVKAFKGRVAYVTPWRRAGATPPRPCRVDLVLLPRFVAGATPRLFEIARARAAFALAGQTINREAHGARTASILHGLVRDARCFGLESGEIDATCDLIEAAHAG